MAVKAVIIDEKGLKATRIYEEALGVNVSENGDLHILRDPDYGNYSIAVVAKGSWIEAYHVVQREEK